MSILFFRNKTKKGKVYMIHKKSANSIIVASIVGLLFSVFTQYYPILEAAKADPHKAVGGVW